MTDIASPIAATRAAEIRRRLESALSAVDQALRTAETDEGRRDLHLAAVTIDALSRAELSAGILAEVTLRGGFGGDLSPRAADHWAKLAEIFARQEA